MLNIEGEVCELVVVSPIQVDSIPSSIIDEINKYSKKINMKSLGVFTDGQKLRESIRRCESLVILVGSGGTERILTTGLSEFRGGALLISYPGNNSLAAAVEAVAALRDMNVNAGLYHHGKDSKSLMHVLSAAKAVAEFRSARIGLIGETEPWLVYNKIEIREVENLGPRVIRIPLAKLYEYYMNVEDEKARDLAKTYSSRASSRLSLDQLIKVVKLFLALDNIVDHNRLSAYTVQCFEIIRTLHVSPCLSLSLHNSKGVVAGCEGDLVSLLGMMIAYYSSGKPAFMGNIVDIEDSNILLSHCTAPLTIGEYHITTHFETGYPAGVSVIYPSGRPATLVKIVPRKRKMLVVRGTIRASTPRPHTCRTQILLKLEKGVDWLLEEELGNHYVLIPGDYVDTLRITGKLLGFDVEVK